MNTTRVLVADAHAVTREGLQTLIGAQPDLRVVGEAADGPAAVALAAELDPDVIVVGVPLPGAAGAEVVARLCAGRPGRKVLALTACEDRAALRAVLAAGACGCVLKRATAAELVRAVRAVAAGGTYLGPAVAADAVGDFLGRPPGDGPREVELSERECEVVRLIALGYSNKEIAARLRLSVKTVETYKARALEKLDLRRRVDLVQYAAKRGWFDGVEPPPPRPTPAPLPAAPRLAAVS